MTSVEHHTVVIVGGGPAGSACATILARHGIDVLVCEKATFPRSKVCGECINPQCWPFLEMLGVADSVRKANPEIIGRVGIRHNGPAMSFQIYRKGTPFLALARSVFDNLLLDNAVRSGAQLIQGRKVASVSHKGRWEVLLHDGTVKTITADYLIGADGRNSFVASSLARRKLLRSKNERIGVQWHTEFQPAVENDLNMVLFPGGYFGVVNVSSDMANIAMVTTPPFARLATADFRVFLEKTIFANYAVRAMLHNVNPLHGIALTSPINPIIHQSNQPFAFLVGDARRTIEPFTGSGILFALQDGISVALELVKRIKGTSSQLLLPRIQHQWSYKILSFALRHFGGRLFRAPHLFPQAGKLGIRLILNTETV